ncbi:hypothetical protein GWI33_014157, partial [Rhynchophorus ferrugineus]
GGKNGSFRHLLTFANNKFDLLLSIETEALSDQREKKKTVLFSMNIKLRRGVPPSPLPSADRPTSDNQPPHLCPVDVLARGPFPTFRFLAPLLRSRSPPALKAREPDRSEGRGGKGGC